MPTWGELLKELTPTKDKDGNDIQGLNFDELRLKYIQLLSQNTGRNVIAYYSGWLKPGRTQNIDINDSDITGFMNSIYELDCSKGLDIILHTPGGNPTATEGIVKYLHNKFGNDIRVIVPQMAMSAGTMLACAAKEIFLGSHSCLGPIDPQYGGIPAYNIIQEFKEAKVDLENNPKSKEFWRIQFEKYPAAFFYSVCDSINLSSLLVGEWLKKYMFIDSPSEDISKKVKKILKNLNSNNRSHSRHFTFDFCQEIGLNVKKIEDDQTLQNLILSVHHAFIITLDNTNVTKIIENQNGLRYISSQSK
ncbi:MAG: serine protease [Bacilli bacterium]|nr:serine protease [Bacilli bacterium]